MKSALVDGSRYGWRGALVLPDEYFDTAATGYTLTVDPLSFAITANAITFDLQYGPTDSDGTYLDITGTSHTAITDVLRVRTDADGELIFTGTLAFQPDTITNGSYNVAAIWRYRTVGGGWNDVGTEISATNASIVTGGVLDVIGSIDVADSQTGLSANTNYEVQLYARRISATPANTILFSTETIDATVSNSGATSYTITVDPATYAITAQSVGLTYNRLLQVATASYAQTLSAVTLRHNKVLQVASLSYSQTLNDVSFTLGKSIAVDPLSYTVARSDVTLRHNRILQVAPLAYSYGLADVSVRHNRVLSVDSNSYTMSFSDVSVVYTPLPTSSIYLGSSLITKVYYNGSEISKAFSGSVQIY